MVNSGSFSSDGDRNTKVGFIQPNGTSDSSQSPSPVSANSAALRKNDFSQTADGVERAIEPTPTKTEFNSSINVENNYTTTAAALPERDLRLNVGDGETRASFFCSVPLNKVQAILSTLKNDNDKNGDVKTKPNSRKILCLYCERTFVNINLRQKHVERSHSTKQNRRVSSRRHQQHVTSTACFYCDKLTLNEHTLQELFEHLILNHPNKYFACLPCEFRFLNSSLLADHNSSRHLSASSEDITTTNAISNYESDDKLDDPITSLDASVKENEMEDIDCYVKLTRSKMKTKGENDIICANKNKKSTKNPVVVSEQVSNKSARNKKLGVKASKIAIKRSKRIEAKVLESQKKKRSRNGDKRDKFVKSEQNAGVKLTDKSTKSTLNSVNPYPEFDNYFRVKKITDHSIDNLKISSLTFDDVFDKAFYNRIQCNIQENLLHHIDGKLFKNEESESRISNFEKVSNVPHEIQNANSENYGCELSLNAVTPAASLLSSSQFGEDPESQIEYGSKPSKKKTQVRKDEVHYKYFTRRKYQASILEQKENRDLSKLDMWTQYIVKNRQQKIIDEKKSAKEKLEYASCEEYKIKMRREELNRILDRRGPFEDLKEEASKKAALEKLNLSCVNGSISQESFTEVRELLNDMLNKVFAMTQEISTAVEKSQKVVVNQQKSSASSEIPSYLNLRRSSTLSSDGEIDKSDKIALICSSQETENYELPTNSVRGKNEKVELTGEWARSRIYVCGACSVKVLNMKQLLEHKSVYHQNVWVQHYEFVGNQSELYRHLSIPGLGKVGLLENTVQSKMWKRSDARLCTKCGKQCNSLGELHRHILECGGDWTWMLARKKCKYRPYGSKSRKKRRGLVKRIYTQKSEPSEKKTYKKSFDGPRPKPSDAETIQRMLANLPPKRITRKIMSLKDGFHNVRNNHQQIKTVKAQNKMNAGKMMHRKLKASSENLKNVVINQSDLKTGKAQMKNKRALRSLNKVLGSRILDTTSSLLVRRKFKALNNKRTTRQSNLTITNNKKDTSTDKDLTKINGEELKPKRCSPRIDKNPEVNSLSKIRSEKSSKGQISIKQFFPVKKKRNLVKTNPKIVINNESNDTVATIQDQKVRTKRKLKESTEQQDDTKKVKKGAFKNLVRTLSLRKKKRAADEIPNTSENESHSTSDQVEEFEKVNKKRRLRNSFRNVVEKIKRYKSITPKTIVQVDGSSQDGSIEKSDNFLDDKKGDGDAKVVVPILVPERSENINIISTPHPKFDLSKEDLPIPETIFNLNTNNEEILQAKGELNFDSLEPAEMKIEDLSTTIYQPVNVDTVEKPADVPIASPYLVKKKPKKPIRGLNDCIAMLTSKLNTNVEDSATIDSIFNLMPSQENSKSPDDKQGCILKVPSMQEYFSNKIKSMEEICNISVESETIVTKCHDDKNNVNEVVVPICSDVDTCNPVQCQISDEVKNSSDKINCDIPPNVLATNAISWNSVNDVIENVVCGRDKSSEQGEINSVLGKIETVRKIGSIRKRNGRKKCNKAADGNIIDCLNTAFVQNADNENFDANTKVSIPNKTQRNAARKIGENRVRVNSESVITQDVMKQLQDNNKIGAESELIADVQLKKNPQKKSKTSKRVKTSYVIRNKKKNGDVSNQNGQKCLETDLDSFLDVKEIASKTSTNIYENSEENSAKNLFMQENEPILLENKTVVQPKSIIMDDQLCDSEDELPLAVLFKSDDDTEDKTISENEKFPQLKQKEKESITDKELSVLPRDEEIIDESSITLKNLDEGKNLNTDEILNTNVLNESLLIDRSNENNLIKSVDYENSYQSVNLITPNCELFANPPQNHLFFPDQIGLGNKSTLKGNKMKGKRKRKAKKRRQNVPKRTIGKNSKVINNGNNKNIDTILSVTCKEAEESVSVAEINLQINTNKILDDFGLSLNENNDDGFGLKVNEIDNLHPFVIESESKTTQNDSSEQYEILATRDLIKSAGNEADSNSKIVLDQKITSDCLVNDAKINNLPSELIDTTSTNCNLNDCDKPKDLAMLVFERYDFSDDSNDNFEGFTPKINAIEVVREPKNVDINQKLDDNPNSSNKTELEMSKSENVLINACPELLFKQNDPDIKETNSEVKEMDDNVIKRSEMMENVVDGALSELTESERNRDVPTINHNNSKNKLKRSRRSKKSQHKNNFVNTNDDDFVFKSSENEQMILESQAKSKFVDNLLFDEKEKIAADGQTLTDEMESMFQDGQEVIIRDLRRSRRSSRKITCYNESEAIDDVFGDVDSKRCKKRSKSRGKSAQNQHQNNLGMLTPEISSNCDIFVDGKDLESNHSDNDDNKKVKVNSDELFDLLKATPNENNVLSKPTNSFFNNFDEISNDFKDDNYDVFENMLEKSIAVIEENLAEKPLALITDNFNHASIEEEKNVSIFEESLTSDKIVGNDSDNRKRTKRKRSRKNKGCFDGDLEDNSWEEKLENPDETSEINKTLIVDNETENSNSLLVVGNKKVGRKKKNLKIDDKSSSDKIIDASIFCEICNKTFCRVENLIKHKRTLTHISKLSEIEAKEAAEKARLMEESKNCDSVIEINSNLSVRSNINLSGILQNSEKTSDSSDNLQSVPPPPTTFSINSNNASLKLADIINDVLNKPVLDQNAKHNTFSDIIMQQNSNDVQPEFKRYKSLGERKSFDSDNSTIKESTYFEPQISKSAGTILEKQITLLENMIENRSNVNYIDDISISSGQSSIEENNSSELTISTSKQEDSNVIYITDTSSSKKQTIDEESFVKPIQYEEISEDSTNLRCYDDQKSRKALNRDEELFLECCSLLKSGSELSNNYPKQSNNKLSKILTNLELKPSEEPDWLENKSVKEPFQPIDERSNSSRIQTPLGDNFADEASNSNTISSNWNVCDDFCKENERRNKERSFTFEELNDDSSYKDDLEEIYDPTVKKKFSNILSKAVENHLDNLSQIVGNNKKNFDRCDDYLGEMTTNDNKKMLTKGAMKVFEGLKVSIPTEELNLDEVFNRSSIKEDSEFDNKPKKSKSNRTKSIFDTKFNLKMKKPKFLSKLTKKKKIQQHDSSSSDGSKKIPSDVYDFEETQDNSDVFTKPDFKSFRNKKPNDAKNIDDQDEIEADSDNDSMNFPSSGSSLSNFATENSKSQQNITKKKCMIMGRIFKNALKSKIDEGVIEEKIEDDSEATTYPELIPLENDPPKKSKMSEAELNEIFDKLVYGDNFMKKNSQKEEKMLPKSVVKRRKFKPKMKKRSRLNSGSTDDEFSLNKSTRKRSYKKNNKNEDNCINLEQELKECIGVASRKSQRKCTSGKQNVLVEYWSSDESVFEAMLENKILPKETIKATNIINQNAITKLRNGNSEITESQLMLPDGDSTLNNTKSELKSPIKKSITTQSRKIKQGSDINKKGNQNLTNSEMGVVSLNRRKRAAANPLYHWSSSSDDESQDLIEVKPIRDELDYDEDRPVQHGWIVGDSPKKLVTMLAQAKGKKLDADSVKELGKKRTNSAS